MSSKQSSESPVGSVFLVSQLALRRSAPRLWSFGANNEILGTVRPLEPGEPLLVLRLFPSPVTYWDRVRGDWVVLDKAGTIGAVAGTSLCWEGEEK